MTKRCMTLISSRVPNRWCFPRTHDEFRESKTAWLLAITCFIWLIVEDGGNPSVDCERMNLWIEKRSY